jgi:hypothetical protein
LTAEARPGQAESIRRQGGETTGRLALASLVEFGAPAARVVAGRLTGTRASGVQVRLADALAAIAERLPQADPDWCLDLGIAGRLARSDEAREAIARAIAALRRADERRRRPADRQRAVAAGEL